ncbi:MAG TPA: hypothetical protein VKR59_14845 [Terriglobales bacterium]|nr:hypothetical protein [Terriglobales bacterium]
MKPANTKETMKATKTMPMTKSMTMTLFVLVLICVSAVSLASAQSPSIIQNTKTTINAVSSQENAATHAAIELASPKSGAQAPSQMPTVVLSSTASSSPKAHVAPVAQVKSPAHKGGAHVKVVSVAPVAVAPSAAPKKNEAPVSAPVAVNLAPPTGPTEDDNKPALDSKYNANGRRDPFISPVVSHAGGSGCSTGKKCLEIGAINLRGVVHSENGFIAVVSNDINKAYFLRENDPVFNGYVVKITGDSIVFQETLQDRLGKTFTREVVKKITTPAV